MLKKLSAIPIILGSQSPRRKALLAEIGLDFTVQVKETAEHYDPNLDPRAIVRSIAEAKASCFVTESMENLIITADTIVVTPEQAILGKPQSKAEAAAVLRQLSGQAHYVLTAVCILYKKNLQTFVESTQVNFYPLSEEEITHYVEHSPPLDKAGSYGIQEWIGVVGIQEIKGSYSNVVGLPTARLYQELKKIEKEL